MSKAEERALEAYPIAMSEYSDSCREYDSNESERLTFIEGYHQAEKDLELSWQDVREIHIILAEIDVDIELCKTDITAETLGYYQEVLNVFKERKENDKDSN